MDDFIQWWGEKPMENQLHSVKSTHNPSVQVAKGFCLSHEETDTS